MPDRDTGWHDRALIGDDGVPRRWHHCADLDHDTLVVDTLEQRNTHERECRKKQERVRAERLAAILAHKKAMANAS